jgi:hypothetical protein
MRQGGYMPVHALDAIADVHKYVSAALSTEPTSD